MLCRQSCSWAVSSSPGLGTLFENKHSHVTGNIRMDGVLYQSTDCLTEPELTVKIVERLCVEVRHIPDGAL